MYFRLYLARRISFWEVVVEASTKCATPTAGAIAFYTTTREIVIEIHDKVLANVTRLGIRMNALHSPSSNTRRNAGPRSQSYPRQRLDDGLADPLKRRIHHLPREIRDVHPFYPFISPPSLSTCGSPLTRIDQLQPVPRVRRDAAVHNQIQGRLEPPPRPVPLDRGLGHLELARDQQEVDRLLRRCARSRGQWGGGTGGQEGGGEGVEGKVRVRAAEDAGTLHEREGDGEVEAGEGDLRVFVSGKDGKGPGGTCGSDGEGAGR